MKFINLFIALTASITCYGNLLKRNIAFSQESVEEFLNQLSEECLEENFNSEYNECFPSITLANYKESCAPISTEKCKAVYKNHFDYYPACKNDPVYQEMYNPVIFQNSIDSYNLVCKFDETGSICPFSLAALKKDYNGEIIQDTCKSKICSDALTEYLNSTGADVFGSLEESQFTTGNFSYNEMQSFKKLAEQLDTDECKAAHAKSGAIAVRNNTVLLVSLSLLLL